MARCARGTHTKDSCGNVQSRHSSEPFLHPLEPVLQADAVQVSARGVAVPDADALALQGARVRAAADEPQQLFHHACRPCTQPSYHELCQSRKVGRAYGWGLMFSTHGVLSAGLAFIMSAF